MVGEVGVLFRLHVIGDRPETRRPTIAQYKIVAIGGAADEAVFARGLFVERTQVEEGVGAESVTRRVEGPAAGYRFRGGQQWYGGETKGQGETDGETSRAFHGPLQLWAARTYLSSYVSDVRSRTEAFPILLK